MDIEEIGMIEEFFNLDQIMHTLWLSTISIHMKLHSRIYLSLLKVCRRGVLIIHSLLSTCFINGGVMLTLSRFRKCNRRAGIVNELWVYMVLRITTYTLALALQVVKEELLIRDVRIARGIAIAQQT